MITTPDEILALQHASELEPPLAAVECHLASLADALRRQDLTAVDRAAADLHAALAAAVGRFARAAHHGHVPLGLRHRLAVAGGQVAAQREALARATASLDRAIDVLIPQATVAANPLYLASGGSDRHACAGGGLQA